MNIDERQFSVLKHIVDIFIKTGEPASSFAVCDRLKKNVSSATIRNDMAKLERLGFLEQPHASAGRIPTYKGFRIYVNSLMEPEHLTKNEKKKIDVLLERDTSSISAIVENATEALSEFTDLAVVCTNNAQMFFVISKVEVIKAGSRVYSVLMVASSGEVKNKICRLEFDITNEHIDFFKKVINDSLVGSTVDVLNSEFVESISLALGSYIYSLYPLLKALYDISNDILKSDVKLKGENNILRYGNVDVEEFIRFTKAKNKLEKILSTAFSGISVVFGKEDNEFAITNSSIIMAKYGCKEQMGTFGVIGPIRLNYKKILPYVSYFSKSITSLVEDIKN